MRWGKWSLVGGIASGIAGGYWLIRYLQPRSSPLVLNGAIVVITGASSGIGAAYARAFAQRGAKLVLTARRAERLEVLRLEVEPYAADVLIVPADITDEAGRAAIVQRTLERYGMIDVLINNAGVTVGGPLDTHPLPDIYQTIQVNLTAPIALTWLVLPLMLTRNAGLIVNMASAAGRIAVPNYSVYGATKHGLIAFADSLRRDVDGTNIKVVSVLPGWVRTEMVSATTIRWMQEHNQTIVEPEEVAEATIHAILNGRQEVSVGGLSDHLGLWLERHFPQAMSLYWRVGNTPEYIAAIRAEAGRE